MNRSTKQWLMLSLVALIPVAMIIVNGRQALDGILWRTSTEQKECSPETPYFPPITFGVYDPEGQQQEAEHFGLEMLYLPWLEADYDGTLSQLRKIQASQRQPVVTVEPWNKDEKTGDAMLQAIVEGAYDMEIDEVIDLLKTYGGPVMLSFGHEMDQDLAERYPWSGASAVSFQEAYRYFWKRVEVAIPQEITWIWAPVVKPDSEKYWPGEDYVDVVGMPIYSFPAWDKSYYGYIRPFQATLEDKVQYIYQFEKPVMIVEFGVTGGAFYEHYWLQEAFRYFGKIPGIQSVVFFQSKDADGAWGDDFMTPDWTSDEQVLSDLITWYQTQSSSEPAAQELEARF